MQSNTVVHRKFGLPLHLAWLSAAALLLLWLLTCWLGDRVWWTLPLLYGPRWIGAFCFIGLLPALYRRPRHALALAMPMTLVFLFGPLDFNLPLTRLAPEESEQASVFRILQLNAGGGRRAEKIPAILAEIARLQPQIVTIAECSVQLAEALGESGDFQVRSSPSRLCFASRWPLSSWQVRDPRDFWEMNGSGAIARAVVTTPTGDMRIGVVHLETPRAALQEYFDLSAIPMLGDITRSNIAQRELESEVARAWIFEGDNLPTLVSGDFNLPEESAIYRRHWGDLINAFSQAGTGTGVTKLTRLWGSRIDHILATQGFRILAADTGRNVHADHLPLFANVVLSTAADKL